MVTSAAKRLVDIENNCTRDDLEQLVFKERVIKLVSGSPSRLPLCQWGLLRAFRESLS